MHSVLERQLKKIFGKNTESILSDAKLSQLLEMVSDTYKHADEDRELLQHSLDIASEEMQKRNEQLRAEIEELNRSKGHVKELEDMRAAMLNIMEDLKEEKKNVSKQLEEIEKFKLAVDNSQSAIIIVKKESREIIYVNKWLEKLTGYKASELVGGMQDKILSETTPQEVTKQMLESVNSNKTFETEEVFYKKKNGDVYQAALSIYPVLNEKKNSSFFVCVHTDITQRKKAEQAKTEFVSIAGHQLRTPLSAIRWYLEELLDKPGEMSIEQSEHLAGLYKSTLRMIDLVNSMLDTARLEVGTMIKENEEVDVVLVVNDTVQEQSINAQAQNINIKVNIGSGIKTITTDKKLMRMIVENLLSNAIKYTQPGGEVSVSLVSIVDGAFAGKMFARDGIGLTVTDNGIGIPEDQVDRVFEKMFRADNARSIEVVGTGLGLYTIKMIINEMGGEIWFDTKEGVGTTFYVYIPYA